MLAITILEILLYFVVYVIYEVFTVLFYCRLSFIASMFSLGRDYRKLSQKNK